MRRTWITSMLLAGAWGEPLRRRDHLGQRQVGSSDSLIYANTTTQRTTSTQLSNNTTTITTSTTNSRNSTTLSYSTWFATSGPIASSPSTYITSSYITGLTSSTSVQRSGSDATCNPDTTVTYPDIPFTTVTLTVTTDYLVTGNYGTNPHAFETPTAIFETPLIPCYTSIIMSEKSFTPGTIGGPSASLSMSPRPGTTVPVLGYAATVIITKKTPVKVYPTTVPSPTSTTVPQRLNTPAATGGDHGYDGGNDSGNNSGNNGGGNGDSNENNKGPHPGQSPSDNGQNNGNSGTPGQSAPQEDTKPTIATIAGEPVTIQQPTVVIGGSTATIPTSGSQNPTHLVVNDKTFTILPGQIIGPSTTFIFSSTGITASTITQPPSTAIYNGVTATIGASYVVISETTYRIGISAIEQTITINGQPVILNSHGVVFPSTTFVPPVTIGVLGDTLYEVVVVNGITISIQGTAAIISGTTFRIGNGATPTTTMINGQPVGFGPSGVVVGTATITPTSVDRTAIITASAGLGPSSPGPSATGDGSSNDDSKHNTASSDLGSKQAAPYAFFIALASSIFVLVSNRI